jgi:hypothetical protein
MFGSLSLPEKFNANHTNLLFFSSVVMGLVLSYFSSQKVLKIIYKILNSKVFNFIKVFSFIKLFYCFGSNCPLLVCGQKNKKEVAL